jgi:hypothetical protein
MTKVKDPHHVILAKRLRNERVELFARINQSEKALRVILDTFTKNITKTVNDKATKLANLKPINIVLHNEVVFLRRSLKVWLNALVTDGAKMGFRHPGDALLPVFKDNQEAITEIVAGQVLFEAKLTFGMKAGFAASVSPTIKLTSKFWAGKQASIIKNITKKNLQGLTLSERVFDLTSRAEADLKRLIANEVANGTSPYNISKKIEKYVSPAVIGAGVLGVAVGSGVYRSPYKNAMRLARTETNRAYVQASAQFYENKPWVESVDVTLSPVHSDTDDCDDVADGGPYSPSEAASLVPVHPHCMCSLTPRIDPQYLGDETGNE